MPEPVIVYTTAIEAYDYDTARTIETFDLPNPYSGKLLKWRKVEIDTETYRVAYQCDRYRSGLGCAITLDDPREVPLGEGRRAPSNHGWK